MKTSLIILFLTLSLVVFSQPDCGNNFPGPGHIENPNTKVFYNSVYATFQVVDYGLGLRYDRRFTKRFGSYLSAAKGKYILPDDKYVDHYKYVLGIDWYVHKFVSDIQNIFFIGASYHDFRGYTSYSDKINEMEDYYRLKHWSFEVGTGMIIGKGFTCAFRFDFLRDESNVDFGWSF